MFCCRHRKLVTKLHTACEVQYIYEVFEACLCPLLDQCIGIQSEYFTNKLVKERINQHGRTQRKGYHSRLGYLLMLKSNYTENCSETKV